MNEQPAGARSRRRPGRPGVYKPPAAVGAPNMPQPPMTPPGVPQPSSNVSAVLAAAAGKTPAQQQAQQAPSAGQPPVPPPPAPSSAPQPRPAQQMPQAAGQPLPMDATQRRNRVIVPPDRKGAAPGQPGQPGQPRGAAMGAAASKAGKPVAKGKLTSQTSRRAHLRITKLDLLAVLKMSFVFAFCASLVMFVALLVLWQVLVASGAIANAQNLLNSIMGNPDGTTTVELSQFLNGSRVTGFIAGVAVINVFIMTLLGTILGALYNAASVLFGGLEVTLEV